MVTKLCKCVLFSYQVLGRDNQSALAHLQEENMLLNRAKKQIEADFLAYKREVALLRDGNSSKEVKILKKVVKNLEVIHLHGFALYSFS